MSILFSSVYQIAGLLVEVLGVVIGNVGEGQDYSFGEHAIADLRTVVVVVVFRGYFELFTDVALEYIV